MPFGPNAEFNPCLKKDQILYDGKNNEGACDCVDDERQLVYYEGECHIQNIQVIERQQQGILELHNNRSVSIKRDLASMVRG